MSIFKSRKASQQPDEMKEVKNLLPETMTMTYTKFVSQRHDNMIDSIKREMAELESKLGRLSEIYSAPDCPTPVRDRTIKAAKDANERIKSKKKELNQAELLYRVDYQALVLATRLDKASQHDKAVDLYRQIESKLNNMLPLINEASAYANFEDIAFVPVVQLRDVLLNTIMPNMYYNSGRINKTDTADLRRKLNERLNELQVAIDKEDAVNAVLNIGN